jgi:cytochrome b561
VRLAFAALAALTTTSMVSPCFAREPAEQARLEAQVEKRATLRTYHRSLGITTWISLGATTLIGTARYANVIGFGTPLCESGSPILGRSWGCGDGLKIQHAISAGFTTVSYASTRLLAALMPDPHDAAAYTPGLSAHRALSWVHLAGMIAMPVLGIATTSSNDPDTRRTLATTHLIVGYSTFAAVSAAGALMTF